jgi:aryl-alcohol dehydrogenase-like predicted oxidoreductase
MTKIDGRTKELATDQINDSLRRLKVDRIDLLQHHEVIRFDGPSRYCTGVAVTTSCMLPLESSASEVNTTVGFPTGMRTTACHLFWRMIGS